MIIRGKTSWDNGQPLTESIPKDRDLSKRDLRAYNFPELDISHVNFSRSNLSKDLFFDCNFSSANMSSVYMFKSRIWCGKMQNVNLQKAYLKEAELLGADLENADLRGADLTKARVLGCNLKEAKLNGTVLRGARVVVFNADFTDAILDNADLRGSCFFDVRLYDDAEPTENKIAILKNNLDSLYDKYKEHKNFDILQDAIAEELITNIIYKYAHDDILRPAAFSMIYNHPLVANHGVLGNFQDLLNPVLNKITNNKDLKHATKSLESDFQKKLHEKYDDIDEYSDFFKAIQKDRLAHKSMFQIKNNEGDSTKIKKEEPDSNQEKKDTGNIKPK